MVRVLGLALALLATGASATIVLANDPDTEPPSGTLTINGGASWTSSATLTLSVPATDNVGVTEVRVSGGGDTWTTFAYAPEITWTHPAASDGGITVSVTWHDAAGNSTGAQAGIGLDRTAPVITHFQQTSPAPAGMIRLYIGALEESTGISHVRLSSNGSTWGAAAPYDDQLHDWDPFDVAAGGSPAIGQRTIHAQVRDGVGNWSAAATLSIFVEAPPLSIAVSPSPRTGSPITLTPTWPSGATFPKGTVCWWEVMWGDDDSLHWGRRNDTFGYVMTSGPASGGWCGAWTFTLPWGPAPRYMVTFSAEGPGGTMGSASIGTDLSEPKIVAAVGTKDRRIRSSNLPVVYILPDSFDVVAGTPVTYRAYPVGGAKLAAGDTWSAQAVDDQSIQKTGGSSFTFVPDRAGHWTVCWGTPTRTHQLAACFDPAVKRKTSGGATGGGGAAGATASPAAPAASPGATGSPTATEPPTAAPATDAPPSERATATPVPVAAAGTATPPAATPAVAAPSPVSGSGDVGTVLVFVLGAVAVLGGGTALVLRRSGRLPRLGRRG